ncbi:PDR/VanB family oxidoreductase [Mycobacterium paraterrae]|uniref:PDR/VanB family oxidoreductase n=1 Tax=Mycobacterium paraterrae TaxID=577492 RepID=A0ABY3VMF6_9MYCO|nr:PDR/VanB family oxidoreductase [Mycobacterium paraterrae]UMB68341.1 PDR/VanB family oxidoreductase [Mycobacterium paraterrae]
MTATDVAYQAHLHPAYTTASRSLRVASVTSLTPQIKHYRLVSDDGTPLTPYQPGSHLIVTVGEHRNAYSLVDDGVLPASYGISVMRRGEGRGSDLMHDQLQAGDLVEIEGPRAMFSPILNQRNALLVAGGIGVTPILSHARAIARRGGTADIIYSYRPGNAAHLDDLREIADRPGITLREVLTVEDTIDMMSVRFRAQPLGTHAYACGPPALLDTYLRAARNAGWPSARVHLERFTAPQQDPGDPFTAIMASSGEVIDVPAGVSLLQRLLDHGLQVRNLCRRGVCGECRITVLAGEIEHRDFVLTDEEKSTNTTMLSCVSRGRDIEVGL